MGENQSLRRENGDLFSVRDMMLRQDSWAGRTPGFTRVTSGTRSWYAGRTRGSSRSWRMSTRKLILTTKSIFTRLILTRQILATRPILTLTLTRVCCRSPIIPARPSYSAELMSLSYSGSLPRSSGTSGSAPDLAGASSPVGQHPDVWVNPMNDNSHSAVSFAALHTPGNPHPFNEKKFKKIFLLLMGLKHKITQAIRCNFFVLVKFCDELMLQLGGMTEDPC